MKDVKHPDKNDKNYNEEMQFIHYALFWEKYCSRFGQNNMDDAYNVSVESEQEKQSQGNKTTDFNKCTHQFTLPIVSKLRIDDQNSTESEQEKQSQRNKTTDFNECTHQITLPIVSKLGVDDQNSTESEQEKQSQRNKTADFNKFTHQIPLPTVSKLGVNDQNSTELSWGEQSQGNKTTDFNKCTHQFTLPIVFELRVDDQNSTELSWGEQSQANNNSDLNHLLNIFSNDFLIKCYIKHKTPSYDDYSSLKNEMSKHYPILSNIPQSLFKSICQTAFIRIEAQEKSQNQANFSILEDEFCKDSNELNHMNQIQSGRLHLKSPWSSHETNKLLEITNEGSNSGEIIKENGKIDWIKVAQKVQCRTPKSCYDKFRSLSVSKLILSAQKDLVSQNFNLMQLTAFTDYQEEELAYAIIEKLNVHEMVTLADVSHMALQYYYSPLSVATKYLIVKSLRDHIWPFDDDGNINIQDFDEKIKAILDKAKYEPHKIFNELGIREFSASFTWCREFLRRHGMSLRTPHYRRRGAVDPEKIKVYLKEITNAITKYGAGFVINMDETFVETYNLQHKVVGQRNVEEVIVEYGNKYNNKEGTTFIAAAPLQMKEKIPLALIAKGTTTRTEKKFGLNEDSEEKIFHSPSGWMNSKVLISYFDEKDEWENNYIVDL